MSASAKPHDDMLADGTDSGVGVVVVNWNNHTDTVACLDSLAQANSYIQHRHDRDTSTAAGSPSKPRLRNCPSIQR